MKDRIVALVSSGGRRDRRVIDRFVETVGPCAPLGRQPLQILARFPRRNHQRHRGGVRSDHQVLGQSSFQTQARHAEGAVLVVQMNVGPVVARFGNAPRHAAQFPILDLPLDRRFAGVIEQRVLIVGHDQQRHQIFEHRTAPRNQDRLAPRSDEQTAHREPVVLRNLPQGDGDVAAQACLGGQQIVETGVTPALRSTLNPMENRSLRRVEQKSKIHRGQFVALPGQGFQCEQALTGMVAGFTQAAREFSEMCSSSFRDWAGSAGRSCNAASINGQSDCSNCATSRKVGVWSSWASFSSSLVAADVRRLSSCVPVRDEGIWRLLTLAATTRAWQSQPRREEEQILQVLLAIPLQSLGPRL